MTRWIGLTGPMGAGKDYAFKTMLDMGAKVVRVSFADGVRREIEDELGLTEPLTKPYSPLERRLLQWWGTDFRRAQDPGYWVKRAENVALSQTKTPVFTDVRFPNEADMIRWNGGILVRVSAPEPMRAARLGMTPPNHRSETALDGYDWPDSTEILYSRADTNEYRRQVHLILRKAGL